MQFHAIGGVPRGGTTLLCNVLNQSPRFFASSTSFIPQTVASTAEWLSKQELMIGELARDKEGTERAFHAYLRGGIEGWYSTKTDRPVVFDKSRAWNRNALLLKKLYPSAKLIIMVRDLRDVFASIERQSRNNPMAMGGDDIDAKAAVMFAKDKGMIGVPIAGIEDVLRRKPDNVVVIKYEAFVENPEVVLKNLYNDLGEEWYNGHDFDNVENVATELDALWLNNFPHDGSGKIEPSKSRWQEWVPPDVAQGIMNGFQGYNGAFGYAG